MQYSSRTKRDIGGANKQEWAEAKGRRSYKAPVVNGQDVIPKDGDNDQKPKGGANIGQLV